MLFTQKYVPQKGSDIRGQEPAVQQLRHFIQNYRKQAYKAALVHGPIGCGKTSSVHALARELGHDLLELNASDLRDQENVSSFLGSALGQQSLFFLPKLILIDEVDAFSGKEDRGGITAVLKSIEKSSFPVICTANDPYEDKLKALRKSCLLIPFPKLDQRVILSVLEEVARQEGITAEAKALGSLARQADGDLRAALIDLQLCGVRKKVTFQEVVQLSDRKRTQSTLQALQMIFKSTSASTALRALDESAEDLSEVFLWLDENLPQEYTSVRALAKAYEYLARADVFQGRIRRRQHWRFLAFISPLLTAGISSAKEEKNTAFVSYKPTMRLLKMWQAKQKHARRKEIAEKLAPATHSSKKKAFQQIAYLKMALAQPEVEKELQLTEEEKEWVHAQEPGRTLK